MKIIPRNKLDLANYYMFMHNSCVLIYTKMVLWQILSLDDFRFCLSISNFKFQQYIIPCYILQFSLTLARAVNLSFEPSTVEISSVPRTRSLSRVRQAPGDALRLAPVRLHSSDDCLFQKKKIPSKFDEHFHQIQHEIPRVVIFVVGAC